MDLSGIERFLGREIGLFLEWTLLDRVHWRGLARAFIRV